MLEIEDLHVQYRQLRVLKGISLHVEEGEIVALVGANAAGKTTLLNAVSRIVPVAGGRIRFRGDPIEHLESEAVIEAGIIQVPEGRRIFPYMTVLDNLEMGGYNKRARADRNKTRKQVFDLFPRLFERKNQLAGLMSGGEQQMLAVGRGLMAAPRILMLDEPSLGLAPLIVKTIFDALLQINQEGVTVLLVEQNVQRSLGMADRGYVLENGRIALSGKGPELLQNTHLKKAYLGI